MICAGIDAGSRTIKVALFDSRQGQLLAAGVVDQGIEQNRLAMQLLDRLLQENRLARRDLTAITATGYGRRLITAAGSTVTEITCQAYGVRHYLADARTIIDIGGQDSKLVRMGDNGAVSDFVMNDRCAAGTGRFLEVLATRLGVRLAELGTLAGRSRRLAVISSMCVVFAETEIIGLLASGTAPEEIVAGVQTAIASRVAAMAGGKATAPIVFTGGVAMIGGMDAALEAVFGQSIIIAPQPQMTGALGAAIQAARHCQETPPSGS